MNDCRLSNSPEPNARPSYPLPGAVSLSNTHSRVLTQFKRS